MSEIRNVILGIGGRLSTISGLRVYTRRPGTIEPPAAIISVQSIEYDLSFDKVEDATFLITVFTQMGSDRGEDQLYSFMDKTGANSINSCIDGDQTLGGVVQFSNVTRVQTPGIATFAGMDYYAAAFEMVVGL